MRFNTLVGSLVALLLLASHACAGDVAKAKRNLASAKDYAQSERWDNLADAMKTHNKVFDDLYTNMVAAGEAGGILDTIFQRLSVYIEKAVKLKRAVQSALVYPIAVIIVAVSVITLILWKVVPQFTILFESMNVDLPLPTRMVIGASKFVGSFGIFIGIGLGILGALFRSYYKTQKGRYVVDGLLLNDDSGCSSRLPRYEPLGFGLALMRPHTDVSPLPCPAPRKSVTCVMPSRRKASCVISYCARSSARSKDS